MALITYIFLRKKVSFTAYLFLFFIPSASYAQWQFTPQHLTAYKEITSLRLGRAEVAINELSDSPATLYLTNLKEALEVIITDDPSLNDSYLEASENAYNSISNYEGDSPYKNYYLAEIKLRTAFIHLKSGNETSAGWSFRKAYKLLEANKKNYPDFIPTYKTLGALHIILGAVPEKHQWLIHLFGMDGDIAKGLNELEKVAESENLFRKESIIITALLNGYLLNKDLAAITSFEKIFNQNKNDMLISYLYMSLYLKAAMGQEALKIYDHIKGLMAQEYTTIPFTHYFAGEVYLQKGAYESAITEYENFIDNYKGSNFVKDAYYKIFLAYWLDSNTTKAEQIHDKAKTKGSIIVEADKNADKMLQLADYPNAHIMKIRLATDGGFYDEANHLLHEEFTPKNTEEKAEYSYRKARLFHKTGKINSAIIFYLSTIEKAKDSNWYFAPNSCLQLGYIYEALGDKSKAIKYYNKVLKYKNHQYKNSLDNKAEAALNRLN